MALVYCGARLATRSSSCPLTFFDDLDAIRSFTGSDHETAMVADQAREVLIRFDERVRHYETAFET